MNRQELDKKMWNNYRVWNNAKELKHLLLMCEGVATPSADFFKELNQLIELSDKTQEDVYNEMLRKGYTI